ncbi:unnamed protein product [Closterium sp. NIES-54]
MWIHLLMKQPAFSAAASPVPMPPYSSTIQRVLSSAHTLVILSFGDGASCRDTLLSVLLSYSSEYCLRLQSSRLAVRSIFSARYASLGSCLINFTGRFPTEPSGSQCCTLYNTFSCHVHIVTGGLGVRAGGAGSGSSSRRRYRYLGRRFTTRLVSHLALLIRVRFPAFDSSYCNMRPVARSALSHSPKRPIWLRSHPLSVASSLLPVAYPLPPRLLQSPPCSIPVALRVTSLHPPLCSIDIGLCGAAPDQALLATVPPAIWMTLYLLATRLPSRFAPTRDHFLTINPMTLTINLIEKRLLAVEDLARSLIAATSTVLPPIFEGCAPSFLASPLGTASVATETEVATVASSNKGGKRGGKKGGGGAGGGGGGGGGGGSEVGATAAVAAAATAAAVAASAAAAAAKVAAATAVATATASATSSAATAVPGPASARPAMAQAAAKEADRTRELYQQ